MARLRRVASLRGLLMLLLLVGVAAVVLQGAGVPHSHASARPGFYDQDHDLVLLATLHGAATLSGAPAAMLPVIVVSLVSSSARDAIVAAPRVAAASRAPPRT